MRFIATFRIALAWLVLQVMSPTVQSNCLRGPSPSAVDAISDGDKKCVPEDNHFHRDLASDAILFSTNADFDKGTLVNVNHDAVTNQLQLDFPLPKPFGFIWVACSDRGTVVKVDTSTGKVLGEYKTAPDNKQGNPSRTTVDTDGSVWVANRANIGPNGKGTIVHIGLLENNQCENRNGQAGIQTSNGLNDIKPWTNMSGLRNVGTAEDECIVHYTEVNSKGTRHISVDSEKNIWVGGLENRVFDKVRGGRFDVPNSGSVDTTYQPVGYGGYGGLIDKKGFLWSSGKEYNLLRWDTSKPLTGGNGDRIGKSIGPRAGFNWAGQSAFDSYGLCIDSLGNVWNTELGSKIHKYSPEGVHLGDWPHGHSRAQGCVVGKNDDVWVAHSDNASTVGHLKNDGTLVGVVTVGSGPTGVAVDRLGKIWATNINSNTISRINPDLNNGIGKEDLTVSLGAGCSPYNYGDMTGSTNISPPTTGSWTVVYDYGSSLSDWGKIQWNAELPQGSSLTVQVKSNQQNPWTPVVNNQKLSGLSGQFLHVQVSFQRTTATGASPILKGLSIVLPTTPTCPAGGVAEVWVGHHSVQTESQHFDQAKIWVISSNPNHVKADGWKPLNESWIPTGYKGVRGNCAYFYTIGAGEVAVADSSSRNLEGALNREEDYANPLHEPVFIRDVDPTSFRSRINDANIHMNNNFINTILQYQAYPWTDWYTRGYGWVEFNSNGYISGLLNYLGVTKSTKGHLYGWDKPVPKIFFTTDFTSLSNDQVKSEVFKTKRCMGGEAEVWVGYHSVSTDEEQKVFVDHAKVWVISSNPNHHSELPAGIWKDLRRDRVPADYKGDKNCAKVYTLGSGFDKNELVPEVDYSDDVNINLSGAVRLDYGVNPIKLKTLIDSANKNMLDTFTKTSLNRKTAFPRDWNDWGWGWNEFNGNGYVSGLLIHLGYYGKPFGGTLPGWEKEVPNAFFEKAFTGEEDIKKEVFWEHPAPYAIDRAINAEVVTQAGTEEETLLQSTSPETMQVSSMDEDMQGPTVETFPSASTTLFEHTSEESTEYDAMTEETPTPTSGEEAEPILSEPSFPQSPTQSLEYHPEESKKLDLINDPSF